MSIRRAVAAGLAVVALSAAAVFPRARPAQAPQGQDRLRATVITVYDGDTVKVRLAGRGDEKVRFIGVDSPELDDARERVRFMAFLAKRFAFSVLYGTEVELLPGPETRDAFGRLLAYVRMADGRIFNVVLVREGFAHAYLKFPFDEAWRKDLRDAEAEARRSGRGLWATEPYPQIRS